ncbi:MAG TPA: VOC family protein [Bryobacteraceae bacterium]|nr:VOC family protein [Bryobacteraceae bacterium]
MSKTAATLLPFALFLGPMNGEEKPKPMNVKKITANLYADEIEPSIRFWQRLGFEKTMEVPAGNKLAFALLKKGNLELMYGTYASLEQDPEVAKAFRKGTTYLYTEVENLEDALAAVTGAELVKPIHKTFYGSKEFSVKDPAGHIITFAQFGAQ